MAEGESDKTTDKDIFEVAVQLIREVIREEKQALMAEMKVAQKEGKEVEEDRLFAKVNELNREENRIVSLLG